MKTKFQSTQEGRFIRVSLLTGGDDPSYALPLLTSLTASGIEVDFIGNNSMQYDKAVMNEKVNYLNLRGDQNPKTPYVKKIGRIIKYYLKLLQYAASTDSSIFHILWLNKFYYFDRTLLNLYYKLMGKKIVFTAHNINVKERDGGDTYFNRATLRFMYHFVDHIFVHSIKMKEQLVGEYGVQEKNVTVIPFGINNHVPSTNITGEEARRKLGISSDRKVILFFGRIARYKGLDLLIEAFAKLRKKRVDVLLIVAGTIKDVNDSYWLEITTAIEKHHLQDSIVQKIQYIRDEDVELYFKSADVLILPYRSIFQTGVLFLSYNFGLPAIVTDVGSLKDEIIEGETGYVVAPGDIMNLMNAMERYFFSELYQNLDVQRSKIKTYAQDRYSWSTVAEKTIAVYGNIFLQ